MLSDKANRSPQGAISSKRAGFNSSEMGQGGWPHHVRPLIDEVTLQGKYAGST
jgi:hypothetical protein